MYFGWIRNFPSLSFITKKYVLLSDTYEKGLMPRLIQYLRDVYIDILYTRKVIRNQSNETFNFRMSFGQNVCKAE